MTSIEIKVSGKEIEIPQEMVDKILGALPRETAGRWKPASDQTYFHLDEAGHVEEYRWNGDGVDRWLYATQNVFRTSEEAVAHKRYLEAVARLRDSSDFVPEWTDRNTPKYYVFYDHSDKKLCPTGWGDRDYGAIAYYPTFGAARQSIKDHKEDWLTYFQVEGK